LARAGGKTLTLLGSPHIFSILESLAGGVKGQLALRRKAGSPAESTLRSHIVILELAGAMVERRRGAFPGTLEYEITEPGTELLGVASILQHWLGLGPDDHLALGGNPGKAAIKGLVDGWSSTVLGVLAAGPLSLTGLDDAIDTVNYPTLERRLATLRFAGQLEARPGKGKVTDYAVTDWVRQGMSPLIAAARWEHHNRQDGTAAIASLDIECAFVLIAPLLKEPVALPGSRRTALRVQNDVRKRRYTGSVDLRDGAMIYSFGGPQSPIDGWVSGSTTAWFSAAIDGDVGGLEFDGDRDSALAMLERLHETLFAKTRLDSGTNDLPPQG
jgi:DNA-binding HxlR family transcriptional regulator